MGRFTFGSFVYEQWSSLPPVSQADLNGKTVVVIGANGGLGFEASKHLAKMKPGKLILGCRDSEKSRNALKAIKEATVFENIELWTIDLASFDSVKAFADRLVKEEPRLDILLENAATTNLSSVQTDDGWESTLQVNCLSTSLLAILLLPHMIQTGNRFQTTPRLAIVSSETHMNSHLHEKQDLLHSGHFWKTYGSREYYTKQSVMERYPDTKLLEIYFARSLTERLGYNTFTPVVTTINPGFCYSDLRRGIGAIGIAVYIRVRLMEILLARSTELGSRTLVHGAIGGVGNEDQMRGAYLSSCQITEAGDNVVSVEGKKIRDALWDEMIAILEDVDPRVTTIVAEYLSSKP